MGTYATSLLSTVRAMYDTPDSDTTLLAFANMAVDELREYFHGEFIATDLTEEDVDEYPLPTGCDDISDILTLGISRNTTPTDRYDYDYYTKITRDDYPNVGKGYYQITDEDGAKALVIYPAPDEAGYEISIRYKGHPGYFSTAAGVANPLFDYKHILLVSYFVCMWLAAKGDIPDTTQADYFSQLWDRGITELSRDRMRKSFAHPKRKRDNWQWHSGLRYVGGTSATEGGDPV